jgi:hypothetical protein
MTCSPQGGDSVEPEGTVTKRTSLILLLGILVLFAALSVGVHAVAAQSEGRIAGIVYHDKNGNGTREEGEEGLADVQIKFDSGGWSTTITTAENGAFSIQLNPATWTVTVIPPSGYTAPEPSTQAYIAFAGDAVTNIEFGLVRSTALPASGGVVSAPVIIAGLFGVMVIGVVMIIAGRRQARRDLSA